MSGDLNKQSTSTSIVHVTLKITQQSVDRDGVDALQTEKQTREKADAAVCSREEDG